MDTTEKINRLIPLLSPQVQDYVLHTVEHFTRISRLHGHMTMQQLQELDEAMLEDNENLPIASDRFNAPSDHIASGQNPLPTDPQEAKHNMTNKNLKLTDRQKKIVKKRMRSPRQHVSRDNVYALLRKFNPAPKR